MGPRLLLAMIVWVPLLAGAEDGAVFLRPSVTLEPNPLMDSGAGGECGGLADRLGKRIAPALLETAGVRLLESRDPGPDDRVLALQIADSRGGDSGSTVRVNALISMRADLFQGADLVATRVFQRRAGILGGQDLCAVKDRIAAALAKDIAAWLKDMLAEQPRAPLRRYYIQLPVGFDSDSKVPEATRAECRAADLASKYAFDRVFRRFPDVRPVPGPQGLARDRLLTVTAVGIGSVSSGVSNHGRSITIRADVFENSRIVATQILSRTSTTGTEPCLNMSRATQLVTEDLGAWLEQGFVKPAAASNQQERQ